MADFIALHFIFDFSPVTHARTAELVDPAAIPIPADLTPKQVEDAVRGAIAQKGWTLFRVVSESPRIEEVEYHIRSHTMAMKLEYFEREIKLSYERSENLNYKVTKNKTLIHPNYMEWSQELADQIKTSLSQGKDFELTALPALKQGNQPPLEPFSAFDQFIFEPATLASHLSSDSTAIKTGTNLDHNISVAMQPKSPLWNKSEKSRTLQIKTHISGLRFVGSGTRFFAGRFAGRSWIKVDVTFIDQATAKVISSAVLYRMAEAANGYTLARADYAMVENMGKDIVNYIDNNYEKPVGGGATPPADLQ